MNEPPKLIFTGHVSDDELRERAAQQAKIAKARALRQMRETMRHAAHRFALGNKLMIEGAGAYEIAALLGAAFDVASGLPGGFDIFMGTFATLTGGRVEQVGQPADPAAPAAYVGTGLPPIGELVVATSDDDDCAHCGALPGMKHSASCPNTKE